MKILVAGDFVPNHRIASQIGKEMYHCLNEVTPIIHLVDYAIVNFESPMISRIAMPIAKAGSNLKCSENVLECVAKDGFGCITLANIVLGILGK